jgi:hypothetical protein
VGAVKTYLISFLSSMSFQVVGRSGSVYGSGVEVRVESSHLCHNLLVEVSDSLSSFI